MPRFKAGHFENKHKNLWIDDDYARINLAEMCANRPKNHHNATKLEKVAMSGTLLVLLKCYLTWRKIEFMELWRKSVNRTHEQIYYRVSLSTQMQGVIWLVSILFNFHFLYDIPTYFSHCFRFPNHKSSWTTRVFLMILKNIVQSALNVLLFTLSVSSWSNSRSTSVGNRLRKANR